MKLKFIMSMIALSTISMNVLALEGKGFRILSETIEASPGVIGGFIQKPTLQSAKPLVAQAWSQAHSEEGRVYQNIRLMGNHHFNISNYTNQKQTYTYKYELNCDGQYFRKVDVVEVSPGGYMTQSADSYIYSQHIRSGLWTVNVTTDITGESSAHYLSTGTLRVTN